MPWLDEGTFSLEGLEGLVHGAPIPYVSTIPGPTVIRFLLDSRIAFDVPREMAHGFAQVLPGKLAGGHG